MTEPSPFERSLKRLEGALDALESAMERREEEQRRIADLEGELQRQGGDRSRLAQALDTAEARAAGLEEINKDVSRRLVQAMETIRAVLERRSG